MEFTLLVIAIIGAFIWLVFSQFLNSQNKFDEMQKSARQLALSVGRYFDVKNCDRCHENQMQVISINSNGKSVRYRCGFCRKTAYALATSPDSIKALHHAQKFSDAVDAYNQTVTDPETVNIFVTGSERPMPYEKTLRSTKKKTKQKARRAPRAKH